MGASYPSQRSVVKTGLPAVETPGTSLCFNLSAGSVMGSAYAKLVMVIAISILALSMGELGYSSEDSSDNLSLNYYLPKGTTPRDAYTRSFSCFVFQHISGFYDPDCANTSTGTVDISRLPKLATQSLGTIMGTKDIELNSIRMWWNTWAYSIRNLNDVRRTIPSTLSEFSEQTRFKSWPMIVIPKSHVKNKTRVIYRSSIDSNGVSVSETLDSTSGDRDAAVLETEIVYERSDESGNHDFYVYDSNGLLSTTADFPAGKRPAPSTCMSCHYSALTGKFGRVGK